MVTNVAGSVGVTRTNRLFIARAKPNAAPRPSTKPIASCPSPCDSTVRGTFPADAPIAMRTPISRVRRDTE